RAGEQSGGRGQSQRCEPAPGGPPGDRDRRIPERGRRWRAGPDDDPAARLNGERPKLIIRDFNLPPESGLQFRAEPRADEALRPIPVVVVTTSAADVDVAVRYRSVSARSSPNPA